MTITPAGQQPREIYPLLALGFKRPLLTAGMKEGIIPEGHVNGPAEGTQHAVRDFRAVPVASDTPEPEKMEAKKADPKDQSSSATSSVNPSDPDSPESGESAIQTVTPTTPPSTPSEPPVSPADAVKASPLSLVVLPPKTTGEIVPPAVTTGVTGAGE
jgi:hypothetical protein